MYDDMWVCLKMAYSPNIAVVGNMGIFTVDEPTG